MIRDALGRSDGAERIEHATGDVEQVVQVISAVGDERTTASIIARAEVMQGGSACVTGLIEQHIEPFADLGPARWCHGCLVGVVGHRLVNAYP